MNAALFRTLAGTVLYAHFAVILFNVFWLVAVPLGAWRDWAFVRNFGWRAAHLISLAVVALQAAAGSLCFLTIWQNDLLIAAGGPPEKVSMIERLVMRAVFWPLPMWAFIVLYVVALVYAVALWWVVPPSTIGD
jgi:Protein of Unknown function (DUF2784)